MIQVLHRAFDVLEQIAQEPERALGLGEIAEHARLPAPTCARILQSLVECGYVEQLGPKKGYLLGPMAYVLASRGPYRKDLVRAAGPPMAQLAEETGETVLLAVLRAGRRVVLHQVEGSRSVQVRGDQLQIDGPLHTATGRLLLAHLPAEDAEAIIEHLPAPGRAWPEAGNRDGVLRALEAMRGQDAVIRADDGEVVGVAVPVREGGRVVAALGLYLPAHRFAGEHRERVLEKVRAAAAAVEDVLRARAAGGSHPCRYGTLSDGA